MVSSLRQPPAATRQSIRPSVLAFSPVGVFGSIVFGFTGLIIGRKLRRLKIYGRAKILYGYGIGSYKPAFIAGIGGSIAAGNGGLVYRNTLSRIYQRHRSLSVLL